MISPKRKIDPGPCMPDNIYHILNGRANDRDVSDELAEANGTYIVEGTNGTGLNARNAPSGEKIGNLPEGTIVDLIGKVGDWYNVRSPAGYEVWVYSKFLKLVN